MTYLTDEAAGLDPIELFEFTFGATVWRFTNSDADYVNPATGFTHTAEPISRGGMSQSEEDGSMSVDIVIDALNPIADFFRTPFLPVQQLWVTVYRTHVGSAFYATLFRGRAGQCVFAGTSATLTCVPMRAALSRRVPVQLVQSLCNNTLYDGRCKANPALFTRNATITNVSGLLLTVTWSARPGGEPSGWYDGGFISKAGVPSATILDDVVGPPATLKLLYNPGYIVGDVVAAYAGCDKRYPTCRDKFNNVTHHQGYPQFPAQDPFLNEIL